MNEAELDAYEEQLTNEAIIDQVKVLNLITIELTSQTFFAAQEQRVVLYRDFERYRRGLHWITDVSAFRQHIAGEKSDSEIASVISSATASFNQISQRINRCEIALKDDLNRADLGRMIRRIQGYEKIKFEAVAELCSELMCRLLNPRCGRNKKGTEIFQRTFVKLEIRMSLHERAHSRKLEAIENINEVMEELRAEIY